MGNDKTNLEDYRTNSTDFGYHLGLQGFQVFDRERFTLSKDCEGWSPVGSHPLHLVCESTTKLDFKNNFAMFGSINTLSMFSLSLSSLASGVLLLSFSDFWITAQVGLCTRQNASRIDNIDTSRRTSLDCVSNGPSS